MVAFARPLVSTSFRDQTSDRSAWPLVCPPPSSGLGAVPRARGRRRLHSPFLCLPIPLRACAAAAKSMFCFLGFRSWRRNQILGERPSWYFQRPVVGVADTRGQPQCNRAGWATPRLAKADVVVFPPRQTPAGASPNSASEEVSSSFYSP